MRNFTEHFINILNDAKMITNKQGNLFKLMLGLGVESSLWWGGGGERKLKRMLNNEWYTKLQYSNTSNMP